MAGVFQHIHLYKFSAITFTIEFRILVPSNFLNQEGAKISTWTQILLSKTEIRFLFFTVTRTWRIRQCP